MWDEPVNDVIDEVARGMTEGSPASGADFRRRVLARIESGGAPRRTWRAAFVLSPLAAAAAIVIAVIVTRGAHDHSPEQVAPQAAQNVPLPKETRREPVVPAVVVARPFQGRVRGAESPALHLDTLQLDANDVASIAVAPLAVDALAPDPIPIERLDAIPPIVVAPLDITDTQRRFE